LAGPVVPLTASISGAKELVGPADINAPAGPPAVMKVLVNGDPVTPPAGRSDDFQWPRRAIAPFGSDPVVATTTEPLPVMKSPQETTVAAPASDARPVAAAAPRRSASSNPASGNAGSNRAPYQTQQQRSPGFSFFSFFR
jgi:uncharacterized protein